MIYDPVNRIIYQKEIILDMCSQDFDSGIPLKVEFPFEQQPLSQDLLDQIDEKYEQAVEEVRIREEQ